MNRKKDEETQTELEPESKKAKPSCEDEEEPAESIISNLAHFAEDICSRFSCGGKIELLNSSVVKVAYKIAKATITPESSIPTAASTEVDEVWSSIEIPSTSKTSMSKLLDVCSVASFGYKDKDVIDKSYRDALKLDPTNFSTTFQLCNTPTIREIESLIPNCSGLQAELYKLNIYGPGGFFKPHVDTPRSGQMFGSLVVCLPTQFSGGELVVRHKNKEIKYDWSSSESDPSNGLQWAAFFSDIEHEVLTVTNGYRVTLTYNLYYGTNPSRSLIDITTNPFYKELEAALSNPNFMKDGGILGFNCHYSYVFDVHWADLLAFTESVVKDDALKKLGNLSIQKFMCQNTDEKRSTLEKLKINETAAQHILNVIPSTFPRMKGADFIVLESTKLLNIPAHIKPILSLDDCGYGYALKEFNSDFEVYVHDEYNDTIPDDLTLNDHLAKNTFKGNVCKYRQSSITWCTIEGGHQTEDEYSDENDELFLDEETRERLYKDLLMSLRVKHCNKLSHGEPCAALMSYGNDVSAELWYKSAAIIIGIPKWSIRRTKQANTSAAKGHENNIVEKCFMDLK